MTGGDPCPHRRVDAHPAKLLRGSPDGRSDHGFHVAQGGVCRDCGFPVLRVAQFALPAWERVAGAAPVPGARRAHQPPHRRSA